MVDSSKSRNKSHQLATRLRREIASGKWAAGEQLPGMRALAERFASNISTIQSAIRLLEGQGLVTCRSRQGAFVVDPGQTRVSAGGDNREGTLPHIGLIGAMPQGIASDTWMDRILRAAEMELMEAEAFHLTRIGSANRDETLNQQSLMRQLEQLAPRMAGAIIGQHKPAHTLQFMERLDRLGLPWVSINHPTEQVIHNFASADNIDAGRIAGRCFLLNGFEKILFLSPDMSGQHLSVSQKAMGLLTAYIHADQPIGGIRVMRCGGYSEADGREAALSYLREHGVPEGVYATGDLIALGAIQAFRENGIRVPDQVSVIGSTGLEAARFSRPGLTVTPQPMEAMGRTAARMLLRMIQTGERRLPGKQLKGGLIVRESLKLGESARSRLIEEGLFQDATNTSPAAEAALAGAQP
jgi:DNA-binding LacI/PurR family transcriptional regulator